MHVVSGGVGRTGQCACVWIIFTTVGGGGVTWGVRSVCKGWRVGGRGGRGERRGVGRRGEEGARGKGVERGVGGEEGREEGGEGGGGRGKRRGGRGQGRGWKKGKGQRGAGGREEDEDKDRGGEEGRMKKMRTGGREELKLTMMLMNLMKRTGRKTRVREGAWLRERRRLAQGLLLDMLPIIKVTTQWHVWEGNLF